MFSFTGMKTTVIRMIPLIRITRDRCAHFQSNTVPEKTHSCRQVRIAAMESV